MWYVCKALLSMDNIEQHFYCLCLYLISVQHYGAPNHSLPIYKTVSSDTHQYWLSVSYDMWFRRWLHQRMVHFLYYFLWCFKHLLDCDIDIFVILVYTFSLDCCATSNCIGNFFCISRPKWICKLSKSRPLL